MGEIEWDVGEPLDVHYRSEGVVTLKTATEATATHRITGNESTQYISAESLGPQSRRRNRQDTTPGVWERIDEATALFWVLGSQSIEDWA